VQYWGLMQGEAPEIGVKKRKRGIYLQEG